VVGSLVELRKTVWNKSKTLNDIDGYTQFLDEAQQRNFQRGRFWV